MVRRGRWWVACPFNVSVEQPAIVCASRESRTRPLHIAINFRQWQSNAERREIKRLVEGSNSAFHKTRVALENDNFDRILRDDHVMGQGGKAGIGRALPA